MNARAVALFATISCFCLADLSFSHELLPLHTYWSQSRRDNFSVSSHKGVSSAESSSVEYVHVRREGFVFSQQVTGTVPLNLYWNKSRGDNFNAASPEGILSAKSSYKFVRVEGYVYAQPRAGTVPLKLYWSESRGDNYVTALGGRPDGYKFVRVEGHILKSGGVKRTTTGFDPPTHGYQFKNSFALDAALLGQPGLGIWDEDFGLCGGMCLSAKRRWRLGQPVSVLTKPPQQRCPELDLFWELLLAQMATLYPDTWAAVLAWQSSPPTKKSSPQVSGGAIKLSELSGTARVTVEREWPRLMAALDKGDPQVICLIRVPYRVVPDFKRAVGNHQVLAVGYQWDRDANDVQIEIYDPNHPGQTESLTMNLDPATWSAWAQTSDDPFRGFFVVDAH